MHGESRETEDTKYNRLQYPAPFFALAIEEVQTKYVYDALGRIYSINAQRRERQWVRAVRAPCGEETLALFRQPRGADLAIPPLVQMHVRNHPDHVEAAQVFQSFLCRKGQGKVIH